MGAALGPGNRMDLVDDHCPYSAEHPAALEGRQHDVERLRSRDQNVWRLAKHPRPRRGRRISSANGDPDLGKLLSFRGKPLSKLSERPFEISLDVVIERFERR